MPNIYTNPDITLTKQENTVLTLSTNGKYVNQNVQMNLSVQGAVGALTASAASEILSGGISGVIGSKTTTQPSSGYYFKVKSTGTGDFNLTTPGWLATSPSQASGSETAYYPIDAATASASGTNTVTPSASVAGTNVTLSNTNNGIQVTATGGGTASATATVSVSAAGYAPTGEIGSTSIDAPSSTTSASSYLSGVTLTTPSSGTRSFSITVPNGSSTTTFTFTVDSSGNVTVS